MKEHYYEKLLQVKTGASNSGPNNDLHYHPYEPTPYHALEILVDKYEIKRSDCIVDFGCGKGRLSFFINYFSNASIKGIEMNEGLYQSAIKNRNNYVKNKENIQFQCGLAEAYQIDASDNRFYFFNPFSIQIFMKIINNILLSMEISNRDIELILYYVSEDYIYYLENHTSFQLKEEIILPDLYEDNPYERFLIYQWSPDD